MDQLVLFERFAVALGIGILIGLERGWQERGRPEGSRVAGIRTFALIGMLGGVAALLSEHFGALVLAVLFAAFAVVMLVGRLRAVQETRDVGHTTTVAAMLTFGLGALAVAGELALAAAGAVIAALLLSIKPALHAWLERIAYDELQAVLRLLVMSVVLLPVLPNRGYGPWGALNPYELWLMVVLIAGISLVGYVIVRLAGARIGLLLAGLAGGLVSSTAVAIGFSRMAERQPAHAPALAAGIVAAAATMFPRTLLIAGALDRSLLAPLAWPLGAAALAGFAAALLLARGAAAEAGAGVAEIEHRNPFELGLALRFGALLAVIMVLARAVEATLGDAGLYLVAAVSGVADVDAITLTYARLAGADIPAGAAVTGILIAAAVNTGIKGALASYIGGRHLALAVAAPLAAALAAGAVAMWIGAQFG